MEDKHNACMMCNKVISTMGRKKVKRTKDAGRGQCLGHCAMSERLDLSLSSAADPTPLLGISWPEAGDGSVVGARY